MNYGPKSIETRKLASERLQICRFKQVAFQNYEIPAMLVPEQLQEPVPVADNRIDNLTLSKQLSGNVCAYTSRCTGHQYGLTEAVHVLLSVGTLL